MSIIIDENRMLEDSVFKFEEKLNSPTVRLIDSTPTFVTYYHINYDETTADDGFKDVAFLLGRRSPIKFNKIENFPLYGLEQVLLTIQDTDSGLDTNFESEATIPPNTIKPLQNDMFVIPYLKGAYIFMITEIMYDNIRHDNFYRIVYRLEYIDEEKYTQLNSQVYQTFTCILENIGTELKCIIDNDTNLKIKKIQEMYDDMASTYKSIFYSDRHNCFLGEYLVNLLLYDPYQTAFINKHNLFNRKNDMETLYLTTQFDDMRGRIKYEKSIYRFIERQDVNLVNRFGFDIYLGANNNETTFSRWKDEQIYIMDIPPVLSNNPIYILSENFVQEVKTNLPCESKHGELLKRFIRKEDLSIHDIPMELHRELLELDANLEVFFFTPIILYIIKKILEKEVKC